jgi:hypothetical protein
VYILRASRRRDGFEVELEVSGNKIKHVLLFPYSFQNGRRRELFQLDHWD